MWILALSLIVGLLITSYITGRHVFNSTLQLTNNESTSLRNTKSLEYLEKMSFDLPSFESKFRIENISITSSLDGHTIPAAYITTDGDKNKHTVIVVHGLRGNRLSSYQIAEIFLDRGYNVIAYDQRSSGENTAQYTTFGYWESHDLVDYISYVDTLIDGDKKIILHGTSFGGATVGIALGNPIANEKAYIAILDSPLSDMKLALSLSMKQTYIRPAIWYLLSMGNITTKLKLGFTYKDASVLNHIYKTKLPTLIIHSKTDTVTPYVMGESIFNAIKHDNKKLFCVDDCEHAKIFVKYPNQYKNEVFEFINKQSLLKK